MQVKIFTASPDHPVNEVEQELNKFLKGVEVVEIFQSSVPYDGIDARNNQYYRCSDIIISVFYNEKGS